MTTAVGLQFDEHTTAPGMSIMPSLSWMTHLPLGATQSASASHHFSHESRQT